VHRLPTEPVSPLDTSLLTWVPTYPDLPMEQVYPRVERTDVPEVYVRHVGQGRVVYFPWDIDRTYDEILNEDHGTLLRNAASWVAGDLPVSVLGQGLVDVSIWRQKDSLTVHLVNLTNPRAQQGPVREIYPVGEQLVRIALPAGVQVRKVQLLCDGDEPANVCSEAGQLRLSLPRIREHQVIAVDLA